MAFRITKKSLNIQDGFNKTMMYLHETFNFVHADDNMIVLDRSVAFLEDASFVKNLSQSATTAEERGHAWRMHIACWFAGRALALGGDFVVCGDPHGFVALTLCRHLNFQRHSAQFYLLDSRFQLASANAPSPLQSGMPPSARAGDGYAYVRGRFADYSNVVVVEGSVADMLAAAPPKQIAFLYLHVQAGQAAELALSQLFHLLQPGAMVLFDDYGQLSNQVQMLKIKEFMNEKQLSMLELPTGQAVVTLPR